MKNLEDRKKFEKLLDEAAEEYRKACQYHKVSVLPSLKQTERHNMRHWKATMDWIDQELARLGET